VKDRSGESYVKAIAEILKIKDLQLIFVILPDKQAPLYNAVKTKLTGEKGGSHITL